jgi:long-chain-fatty-acid--[acyl-carrier-protein] ligase
VTVLAAALSAAMTGAPTKLAVLNTDSGTWAHHPVAGGARAR